MSKIKNILKQMNMRYLKARQEDILRKSKFENWILSDLTTFSENRLQLGVLKKEWLYRALKE